MVKMSICYHFFIAFIVTFILMKESTMVMATFQGNKCAYTADNLPVSLFGCIEFQTEIEAMDETENECTTTTKDYAIFQIDSENSPI